MKFVVNRVSPHSIHYGSVEGIEGMEVCIDKEFGKSILVKGYCEGRVVRDKTHTSHHVQLYAGAFTVAEVPDTEEGYYLL